MFPKNYYGFLPENSLFKVFSSLLYVENFQKWENDYIERPELLHEKCCQKQKLNYLK